MRLKQVLSQGRACRGYLEKRTFLGARTTRKGFLEAVVYEGPGRSLRRPESWLAPGALEISPVFSSAEWGQARPPAGGCQWGCVTKPSTPARCAPRSLSAEEESGPRAVEGLPSALQPRLDLRSLQQRLTPPSGLPLPLRPSCLWGKTGLGGLGAVAGPLWACHL